MKIAVAGDHAGPDLRAKIIAHLIEKSHETIDLGADGSASVDYPDYAHKLAAVLASEPQALGILVCGTGVGISIAANRHVHVRAALCHDITTARLSREHNDANVLVLGARVLGEQTVLDCIDVFLQTEFQGGRHAKRVDKINPTK